MPESLSIAAGLQALAAKVENQNPHAGTERILFVEDNSLILENSTEMLQSLGYQVQGALDAKDAIQALVDGFEPELICCDIVLPGGMNGVELARQIIDLMPEVRVLLVSGYGAGGLDGLINQDGFHMLSKPYLMYDLGARIRKILDDR